MLSIDNLCGKCNYVFLGCPIKQEIIDNAAVSAYGEGLTKGFEDQIATFFVEARGQNGEVTVQVDGMTYLLFFIRARSLKYF